VDIRLPEKTPTVVRLLTPAEVLTLASAMPDRYALLVLLGAGTGLRQGEAFGLTLDRVNADDGMLTVDRQVIVANRRPILAPPKTSASVRDVPMPVFVQEAIAEHTERFGLGEKDVMRRTPRLPLLRRDCYNRHVWNPPSRRLASWRTQLSTTCCIPSPARPWPRACQSRRCPTG
jgi:integrase